MLSLFENYPDLTIVDDSYDRGRFVDDVARELVGTLRSHGLPYYAWKYPDSTVVPWHEAAAKAVVDWEASVGGYPFRDIYDSTAGAASETLEAADRAFKVWGIAPGEWYACVHVREASYIGGDAGSGQGNRNANIEQYDLAVKHITERGGWVIKLGAPGSPPLPEMPRVVDYARSPFKSELMDIHLIRHARFFVGTTSGLANVAVSFGLPTAQVNCLTTEAQPWHSGVRFCLKPVYKADGAILTQRELVASQWRWGLFTVETMKRYGLTSQDNSAEDILQAVKEVEALAAGRGAELDANDQELLRAWREAVAACPHQYGASSPSIHYLRKYHEPFLERH
jgi:putative glycosyltransferase (TIGR04372 family)